MATFTNSVALAAPADTFALPPLVAAGPHWRERLAGWAGAALSLGVLAVVAVQLGRGGLARVAAGASASPAFWAVFVVAYLATPACEWLIFHRLWRLPAAGLLPLLRKEVSNELLFGYSGDAQFYLWARRRAPMAGSPFGAIKDVAILSAVAGNVATLAMMAATAPLLAGFAGRPGAHAFAGSVAIVVAISLALFVLRKAVFSLNADALRMIFAVHGLRIALHVGLAALMWHLLLPGVTMGAWMALATIRQMVSRLPLVSNKDVLFAGVAMVLLGDAGGVAGAIATVSGLTVAAHLLVGAFAFIAPVAARMGRA